ncbi:helix-turn-helix domain-containing protein [Hyphomonas sp. NPDC076900]|uniref:helix-turn-helix domain-containing protein n=1 Tax=unclassified Hyphomonas TaxID=2630699 RepID=UPI003CFC1244
MTNKLFSVEAAAERLQLHTRTILRFIREGRLKATKIGKQYRILGSDLDALAGISVSEAGPSARVTAVVDVPDVDERLLQRMTASLMGAVAVPNPQGDPLSVNLAHDPVRRTLKVIAVGSPNDVAGLLGLVDICLEG